MAPTGTRRHGGPRCGMGFCRNDSQTSSCRRTMPVTSWRPSTTPRRTGSASASARAATAGRRTTCATAACSWTSAGWPTAGSTQENRRRRRRTRARRQRARLEVGRTRPFLPGRPLQGRRAGRLPAAGRLRLEQPRARTGLRERARPRRRHSRRRTAPLQSRPQLRSLLGGKGFRPRLLRRRHCVPPPPAPPACGLRQQPLRLPHRPGRRDLHVGAEPSARTSIAAWRCRW